MKCKHCGHKAEWHGDYGCRGWQYLLPGVAERCLCGITQAEVEAQAEGGGEDA